MAIKFKASDYTLAAIRKRLDEAKKMPCKNAHKHTPQPEGYVEWHEWAIRTLKLYRQVKCRGCGLYKIWVKKTSPHSGSKKLAGAGNGGVRAAKGGSSSGKIERGPVKRADAFLARRSE